MSRCDLHNANGAMLPERLLSVHQIDHNEGLMDAASDLAMFGISLVALADKHLVASAFTSARDVLDSFAKDPLLAAAHNIPSDVSSAHASGYHGAGCLSSKYNAHREGFVFSDQIHFVGIDRHPMFEPSCRTFHRLLYDTANMMLSAIHTSELGEQDGATGSVQEVAINNLLQPIDRTACAQWHIKRFHRPSPVANSDDDPSLLWLPTHMDPSLLSVVVHDRPAMSPGGAGLQYFHQNEWLDVPVSGHDVAIVLVGSVLPVYSPCRHRVRMVSRSEEEQDGQAGDRGHHRMAATFFLRPRLEEKLKNGLTYEHWLARTSRRYDTSKN